MMTICIAWIAIGLLPVVWSKQLLVMSFDGFRYDYFDQVPMPNLKYIAKTGVHAKDGMQAVFATKTFPAHWTLATGLYEESHGVVDNFMYDPIFNETFNFGGPTKWWGGEPIWVTAKRHGKKVGVYFWPGSEVAFNGIRPDHYHVYNQSIPYSERLLTALKWLTEENFDLVMLYHNEPDSSGHRYGAGSVQVRAALEDIDLNLGMMLSHLKDAGRLDTTNILIVSDHGMTNVTLPYINLNNYIDAEDTNNILQLKATAMVDPKENHTNSILRSLRAANKNMSVYLKEEIPERFHYRHNRRIGPILVVANEGYVIKNSQPKRPLKGNHGYDNVLPSMRPVFVGRGPDFKIDYKMSLFESVNVYMIMCRLLRIEPAPNNGTLEVVNKVLRGSAATNLPTVMSYIPVVAVVLYQRIVLQRKLL